MNKLSFYSVSKMRLYQNSTAYLTIQSLFRLVYILACLSVLVPKVYSANCFDPTFPKLWSDTVPGWPNNLIAVTHDPVLNRVYVGGHGREQTLNRQAGGEQRAMVAMYENGGSRIAWARATQIYGSSNGYVKALKLNYDKTKLVVAIYTTGMNGFIVLNPNTGSTFWVTNEAGQSTHLIFRFSMIAFQLEFDSGFVTSTTSDRLYSIVTKNAEKPWFMALDFDTSPKMYESQVKESAWAVRVVNYRESHFLTMNHGETDKTFYVAGFFESTTSKKITGIIRFEENGSGSSVTAVWQYGFEGVQSSWANSWAVDTIHLYEDSGTGNGYLFGTIRQKGAYSVAGPLHAFRIQLESDRSQVPQDSNTMHRTFGGNSWNRVVTSSHVRSATEIEFIYRSENSSDQYMRSVYYCKMDLTTGVNNYEALMSARYSQLMYSGAWAGNGQVYYVGVLREMTVVGGSYTEFIEPGSYDRRPGFLEYYSDDGNYNRCITDGGSTGSYTTSVPAYTWQSYDLGFINYIFEFTDKDDYEERITPLSEIYDQSFCFNEYTFTGGSNSISTQTYMIGDPALVIPYNGATLSGVGSCSDNTDIGAFVEGDSNEIITIDTSAHEMRVETSNPFHVNTYTIKLCEYILNGQLACYSEFDLDVTGPCNPMIVQIGAEHPDEVYYSMNPAKPIVFEEFTHNKGGSCELEYYLTNENENLVDQELFTFNPTTLTITVFWETQDKVGFYTVRLYGCKGSDCAYDEIIVYVLPQCTVGSPTLPNIPDQTYKNGGQAVEFTFDAFPFTSICDYKLSDFIITGSPGGVKITSDTRTIKISGVIDPGSYTIKIQSTFTLEYNENEQGDTIELEFKLDVSEAAQTFSMPSNLAPIYTDPITEEQIIEIGTLGATTLSMGKAEDLEEDDFTTKISKFCFNFTIECVYDGSDFITFDGQATFTIPEVTESQRGEYNVECTLQEVGTELLLSRKYSFKIKIDFGELDSLYDASQIEEEVEEKEIVKPIIENLYVPEVPDINLDKIDRKGIVSFDFTKEMQLFANMSMINQTSIDITVLPGHGSDPSKLTLTWECIKYSAKTMDIQLYFDNAVFVSNLEEADTLQVKIIDDNFFIDYELQPLPEKTMLKKLPLQMQLDEAAEALEAAGNAAAGSSKAVVIGNMVMNIVLSGAMNLLWGMVNALQLIVVMPLLLIKMPANASSLLLMIMGIANFEVLPTDDIFGAMFNFTDTQAYNEYFELGGFETSNFVFNLGTLFFGFIFFAFFVLLMCLLKLCSKIKFFDKAYHKVKLWLFFNGIIRFILEGFLELIISSYVNLRYLYWDNPSNVMASLFAVVFAALTFIFPIAVVIFIYKQKENFANHDTESRFGALYEGVRHHNTFALMYTVVFLLRRIAISFNILYIGYGSFQIMIYKIACVVQLSFLCSAKPMAEPLYNYLEIFNETTVWLITFHLILFTDYVSDPELRQMIGWSAIGVTMINVVVNLLNIVVESGVNEVRKCKYNKRKKIFMKKYRQRLENTKLDRENQPRKLQAFARKEHIKQTNKLNDRKLEEIVEVNSEEIKSIDSEFYNRTPKTPNSNLQIQAYNNMNNFDSIMQQYELYNEQKLAYQNQKNESESNFQRFDLPQEEDIRVENFNDTEDDGFGMIQSNNNQNLMNASLKPMLPMKKPLKTKTLSIQMQSFEISTMPKSVAPRPVPLNSLLQTKSKTKQPQPQNDGLIKSMPTTKKAAAAQMAQEKRQAEYKIEIQKAKTKKPTKKSSIVNFL